MGNITWTTAAGVSSVRKGLAGRLNAVLMATTSACSLALSIADASGAEIGAETGAAGTEPAMMGGAGAAQAVGREATANRQNMPAQTDQARCFAIG